MEGNKEYLVDLGFAKSVNNWSDFEAEFKDQLVIVKQNGTRSSRVCLYGPENSVMKSVSSKKDIKQMTNKGAFVQPFYDPFLKNILEVEYKAIYRMYFFFDLSLMEYVPIAGACTGRPKKVFENEKKGFQIHGTPDSVFWPALFA